MTALITIVHIFVCFVLIVAVLLQSGKAADLAGAFGGIGSQSVFGPRGAGSILSKITTACAILFMFTSMGLWIMGDRGAKSVIRGEEAPVTEKAAATETKQPEQPAVKQDEGQTQPEQKPEQQGSETEKKTPPDKK